MFVYFKKTKIMKKLLISIILLSTLFQSKSYSCCVREGIYFREPSKSNQIIIGKVNATGPLMAFNLLGQSIPGLENIPKEKYKNYDYSEKEGILLVSHDGVYNFYDIKKSFSKIGEEYTSVTLFNEGLAIVSSKKDRLKIIDSQGLTVATLNDYKNKSIELATEFNNGLAAIKNENNLWGFIDVKGNIVIEPQFDNVSFFNENYCVVQVTKKRKTSVGIINKKGEFVFPLTLNIKLNEKVSNGIIGFKKNNESFGFMDINGKVILNPSTLFNWIGPINKIGLAVFSNGTSFGVLNKEGKIIVRSKFGSVQLLDNLIIGMHRNDISIFDLNGKEIKQLNYLSLIGLNNGNFLASDYSSSHILLDKNFNEINKTSFIAVECTPGFNFRNNYARTDYYDTKKIINNSFLQLGLTNIAGLKAGDGPTKMIDIFDLGKSKQFDLINEDDNDVTDDDVVDVPAFEEVEANMFGIIKSEKTETILTPLEAAIRAADSIASLEEDIALEEPNEDESSLYYDTLRFLSDKKIQTINVYDVQNFELTFHLGFNDFVKTNTFEEKKNSCNTCNLIGTSINKNAKLISYDLIIEMNGKASGKAKELVENLKEEFISLGLKIEKKGFDYQIVNPKLNNKKVGILKSTNDDLVIINYVF